MNHSLEKSPLPFGEFITLMAMMMSLVALSIDAVLPALPVIGEDLGVANANDVQLVVVLIFLGMALGQLIYGPLSDSIGRKPAISIGMGIFVIGSLCSVTASNFEMMLLGRLLEGLGLGAPRVVCIALIRDLYKGHTMAQVMSFIMTIFILVPMIAPLMGQGILWLADWHGIFVVVLSVGLVTLAWFNWRLPETLPPERRRPYAFATIFEALKEIITNRVSVGYTLMSGLVSGAFLAYLSSIQQVLGQLYGLGDLFPPVFAVLALFIGSASFVNARMVKRFGMRTIARRSLLVSVCLAVGYLGFAFFLGGQPPLWSLLAYFAVTLFCTGLLFGNMNAIAMEPLGHIAGIGAAMVGSVSTLISVPLGIAIGRSYDGTVIPLVAGFGLVGMLSLAVMAWVSSARRQH